jgi:small-conductance mechanosensitive channel
MMLEDFVGSPLFAKLVITLAGLIIIYVISRVARKWLTRAVRDDRSRYRSRKLVSFVTVIVVILFITVVYSEQLGGLTVALGLASAGVAFALQEVITSIAGWIALSFGDIYKTGDRIKMGGVTGDVIDIGVVRTTLMELGEWVRGDLYSGRVVRVANSFVFKEPIFNYSGDFPFLWDEITIPVRYGSDLELTRKILNRVARDVVGEFSTEAERVWARMVDKYLIEQARVDPMVSIVADESWVTATLRYVVDFKKRRTTKDELYSALLTAFADTNGKVQIAAASQEITLVPHQPSGTQSPPAG